MGVGAELALVLAEVGWYVWRARGADDPNAALSLSGNVDVHQVELAFRVTGRISEMKVQEGGQVSAGETLGQLDRVPLATDVAAAKADVAQAQAQLDKIQRGYRVEEIAQARATVAQRAAELTNARVTLQRQQQLVAARLGTHQQIDDAEDGG